MTKCEYFDTCEENYKSFCKDIESLIGAYCIIKREKKGKESISLAEHNRIKKEIVSQHIKALEQGKYIDVHGVNMVCYYIKEHKEELKKWREVIGELKAGGF